jgi:hypothetical protein
MTTPRTSTSRSLESAGAEAAVVESTTGTKPSIVIGRRDDTKSKETYAVSPDGDVKSTTSTKPSIAIGRRGDTKIKESYAVSPDGDVKSTTNTKPNIARGGQGDTKSKESYAASLGGDVKSTRRGTRQRIARGRRGDTKSKESYAVSPDGDLALVQGAPPSEAEEEESEDSDALPGAVAVNADGGVLLVKGQNTCLGPTSLPELMLNDDLVHGTASPVDGWFLTSAETSAPPENTHQGGETSAPPEKTRHRKWYYMIGIFLVVVVGAVGAGVGVALSGSDDDSSESENRSVEEPAVEEPAPTQAPGQVAPRCEFNGIDPDITKLSDGALARYEMLLEDFPAQVVLDFTEPVNPDDYCTPTNLALIWLASDDEDALYSEEQLTNRYILGLLHVATNGFGWVNSMGWLSGLDECEWFGVICDDGGKITELRLPDNRLHRTIPSEIGLLSGLKALDLQKNRLEGQVPTTIGALSDLSKYSVW